MGTISDKLMRIINTKEDIRQALISKGYDVPTSIPFKEYAKMISDLPCKVDDFPKLPGDVTLWYFGGLTNEMMAAMDDPRIEDADHKGRFLSFKNFAWGGMSGVGGYTENYNSNKWYKVESRIDATWTYKSFNARSIKDNRSAQLFYQSSLSDTGFRVLSCTIKVSGLTDGQGIEYVSNGTQQFVIMRIENDGIYHLPSFDFGAKNAYYGFKFLKLQESCNITIEQIPEYEGYLITDGVDDKITSSDFKIGKDFTIVGDWKFIDNKKSGTGLVKGSSFYIYNTMTGLDLYINSGSVKNSLDGIKSINAVCSDGRAYDRNWNEILANTGNIVGSGGMLEVSSSGGRFDRIAFKNLAIYPRILSKDDCIKAYNYLQTLKSK